MEKAEFDDYFKALDKASDRLRSIIYAFIIIYIAILLYSLILRDNIPMTT